MIRGVAQPSTKKIILVTIVLEQVVHLNLAESSFLGIADGLRHPQTRSSQTADAAVQSAANFEVIEHDFKLRKFSFYRELHPNDALEYEPVSPNHPVYSDWRRKTPLGPICGNEVETTVSDLPNGCHFRATVIITPTVKLMRATEAELAGEVKAHSDGGAASIREAMARAVKKNAGDPRILETFATAEWGLNLPRLVSPLEQQASIERYTKKRGTQSAARRSLGLHDVFMAVCLTEYVDESKLDPRPELIREKIGQPNPTWFTTIRRAAYAYRDAYLRDELPPKRQESLTHPQLEATLNAIACQPLGRLYECPLRVDDWVTAMRSARVSVRAMELVLAYLDGGATSHSDPAAWASVTDERRTMQNRLVAELRKHLTPTPESRPSSLVGFNFGPYLEPLTTENGEFTGHRVWTHKLS